jgi:hypothetical protein
MVIAYTRISLLALLGAAALPACSGPYVAAKPSYSQQSLGNERDWNAAALRLVESMAEQGFIPSSLPPAAGRTPFPPPYYVNVVAQGSTFLAEVRQSIEHELLFRNLPIARSPDGATVINLDLDFVQWGSGADVAFDIASRSRTELVWHASVLIGNHEAMKGSEVLYVAADDIPLYAGSGTPVPPLASPGASLLGAARPLQYAR